MFDWAWLHFSCGRCSREDNLLIRRNHIIRDRTHPLELFNDLEVFKKFRFRREDIFAITDEVNAYLECGSHRGGGLAPILQVLVTLRFYAIGTFQDVVGELLGVHQLTASKTIARVTDALLRHVPTWIKMPTQTEADATNFQFFCMHPEFANTIRCIDGTHVKIQAPSEAEHEYMNRKNFLSINVQVSL